MLRYISALPGPAAGAPRTLTLLGSTGSIGRSALEVIRLSPESFHVVALAGARNIPLLAKQAAEFRPDHLGLLEEKDLPALRALLPAGYSPAIVIGQSGYETLASLPGVDMVLSAQVGAAGLRATASAVRAGKTVALANKESLVLAGHLIRQGCAASGARILPVDSEHNALFQCLAGSFRTRADADPQAPDRRSAGPVSAANVARLILTASGGPFFGKNQESLRRVTPAEALAHPNWNMGAKVTIDSATLMNKGLELIEAHHLYGLALSDLEVIIHRESVIHSLVEFTDGSQLAQLGTPDMRIPIAYCLGWPTRPPSGAAKLDLAAVGSLHFSKPDAVAFPCLALARDAQTRGKGCPVVLNAANEIAVQAFLDGRLPFTAIAALVKRCLEDHASGRMPVHDGANEPASVEEVLALDAEVRVKARERLHGLER
jgi:1-deoxy-D-xylulose-5-phosphate reductoisomerase